MRIAQILDTFGWGGVQELQVMLAEAAAARGIELVVVGLRGGRGTPYVERLRGLGVEVATFPAPSLLQPARLVRLVRFLRKQRCDTVHVHLRHANILGVMAARAAGLPVVASLHVQPPGDGGLRQRVEDWSLRFGTRAIIAVGDSVAESYRPRLGGRRIELIPNPVRLRPPATAGERAVVRESILSDPSAPLLLSVGRLRPEKGCLDLLEAFEEVAATHPAAALAIVGAGPLHEALEARIAASERLRNVALLGARDDVQRLLAAADVYVSASHSEGLSISILEAMAAGLPVVATDVGDTRWLLEGHGGLVVPPRAPGRLAGCLRELLDDPAARGELGRAAREHVARHHDVDMWLQKTLAVYERVLSKPRARA